MASNRYDILLLSLPHPPNRADYRTGHYARKGWKTPSGSSIPRPQLLRSSDPTKDQNYYLSAIPEKGLERALFPLGELTKTDVRRIAEDAGLPTARRDESMGICFVGQKRRFNEFLGKYVSARPTPLPGTLSCSCHASLGSKLSGTKPWSDMQPRNRGDSRNTSWTVDVHHRSRGPNTGTNTAVLRRFKEQGRKRDLRSEKVQIYFRLDGVCVILMYPLSDTAIIYLYSSTA